jgi:hypothetical protein
MLYHHGESDLHNRMEHAPRGRMTRTYTVSSLASLASPGSQPQEPQSHRFGSKRGELLLTAGAVVAWCAYSRAEAKKRAVDRDDASGIRLAGYLRTSVICEQTFREYRLKISIVPDQI